MLREGVSQVITQVLGFSLRKYGEISQGGMSRHSGPRFVNDDCGTAELACSTAHARRKARAWSRPFVLFCTVGLQAHRLKGDRKSVI